MFDALERRFTGVLNQLKAFLEYPSSMHDIPLQVLEVIVSINQVMDVNWHRTTTITQNILR